MKILLFGGFLGSGKTTIIRAFIDSIISGERGTVAIIENEIGEVGIDDALLREGSVKMTPLFGGCVCCEITGSLIGAVDEIYKQIAPDWLIVELTGVAELGNVKDLMETYVIAGIEVVTIAVVDGSRWHRLQIIGDFIREQVLGCDLLIVNKTDLCAETDSIVDDLRELTGAADIMLMAADRDRVAESGGILDKLFGLDDHELDDDDEHDHDHEQDDNHDHDHDHDDDDHDHDDDEHDHEHEDDDDHDHDHDHDHDERMVGAYSLDLAIHEEAIADKTALIAGLSAFFTEIGDLLGRDGIIYGHVKGILRESDDSYARFSLTHPGEPDILTSDGWHETPGLSAHTRLTLNMNSMIHTVEEIVSLITPALSRYEKLFS